MEGYPEEKARLFLQFLKYHVRFARSEFFDNFDLEIQLGKFKTIHFFLLTLSTQKQVTVYRFKRRPCHPGGNCSPRVLGVNSSLRDDMGAARGAKLKLPLVPHSQKKSVWF